jgi:hypothetical protein
MPDPQRFEPRRRLWDPFGAWPRERPWIWWSLAFWTIFFRGPDFMAGLQVPARSLPDFFQEWASARNYFEGLPIYTKHWTTAPLYLGITVARDPAAVVVNAHPPTSVLLALPFAGLDFSTAFLAWNLFSLAALAASLWLVKTQLDIPIATWSAAPFLTLPCSAARSMSNSGWGSGTCSCCSS